MFMNNGTLGGSSMDTANLKKIIRKLILGMFQTFASIPIRDQDINNLFQNPLMMHSIDVMEHILNRPEQQSQHR